MIYKIVQTGAKTQLGGLKKGFSRVRNQVFTEDRVAKLDKNPIRTETDTEMMILVKLAFFKMNDELFLTNK